MFYIFQAFLKLIKHFKLFMTFEICACCLFKSYILLHYSVSVQNPNMYSFNNINLLHLYDTFLNTNNHLTILINSIAVKLSCLVLHSQACFYAYFPIFDNSVCTLCHKISIGFQFYFPQDQQPGKFRIKLHIILHKFITK